MVQDRRKQYQSKKLVNKQLVYAIPCGCDTSDDFAKQIGGLKSVTVLPPKDNTSPWMKMINEAEWQLWNLDKEGNYKQIK